MFFLTSIMQFMRTIMGKWRGRSTKSCFESWKKCPGLGKTRPICCHLCLKFLIPKPVLRAFKRKNPQHSFLWDLSFMCWRWHVYGNTLISRNLAYPETFLAERLLRSRCSIINNILKIVNGLKQFKSVFSKGGPEFQSFKWL